MQCLMQEVCFAKAKCNVWCQNYALRKKIVMFDAKSMLCERKMQCLMQKACFAKEKCNVWCKKHALRKKNAMLGLGLGRGPWGPFGPSGWALIASPPHPPTNPSMVALIVYIFSCCKKCRVFWTTWKMRKTYYETCRQHVAEKQDKNHPET